MKLIVLFGPPSVGKTTIGRLIESKTNFKLFHNHMVMDGIMHIFGVGTPSENRLSKIVRALIIEEAADSGIDLIFTYVWNFGQEKGKINIDTYKQIYENHGGEVVFIELSAPLDVRIERAKHPDRKQFKAHAPDAKRVAELENSLDLTSPSPFFYPDNYTKINTANKAPDEIAQEIIDILG
jgi:hypothetical protein